MKKSFVLMTAMPPTNGHLQLIQFANQIAKKTYVILCTQPHEPMCDERENSIKDVIKRCRLDKRITVIRFHKTIEQNPNAPGFWNKWKKIMIDSGIKPGDYIVASEAYGQKLANITGTEFFPYDIDRSINPAKATTIRDDTINNFSDILPEFQKYLTTTVTVFGAESTGKTTLSRQLAKELLGYWIFEYARPYLENTINEITPRSMKAIWKGQTALQRHIKTLHDRPYIIQDTDLFSTVGYWQFPHWKNDIGNCPSKLIKDAISLQSDLYIITKSNIPFESDPLRYGGDTREGSDDYWINICKQYNLSYIILDDSNPDKRIIKAKKAITKIAEKKMDEIKFDRHGL